MRCVLLINQVPFSVDMKLRNPYGRFVQMRPALRVVAYGLGVILCVAVVAIKLFGAAAPSFTLEQIRSYPYPSELTAAAKSARIAWTFNEQGKRNVWVAQAPDWRARRLTDYDADDGQEISSLALSADGQWVVYVRGGDHGSNWDDSLPVNPTSNPTPPRVAIWSVPFAGGEPRLLAEGDEPVISPRGERVAFVRDRSIWSVPIDGSAPAQKLFVARGDNGSPVWSPDGSRLAFVSDRGDHSFIGIYADERTPILWLAPSTSRDTHPRWSPDGRRLAFVRRPGTGGPPEPILEQRPAPWALWTADAFTGQAHQLWTSPNTSRGSFPTTHGGPNLHWAADGRIIFLSYMDGWPHLYSIPEKGGEPLLLTPGRYMAEHISISPDRRFLVFAANAGADPDDIDRRHIVRVPVDRAAPEVLTPGSGLEWSPVVTGDMQTIAFLSATAQRPPLPTVMPFSSGPTRLLAEDRLPADFPTEQLVVPKKVVYRAPDGLAIHAQLFMKEDARRRKRPAIVYIHGGPPRQMLLGWHYSDYYANAYALNQYLASRGYIVLSINYRLGIGYGYEFQHPPRAGSRGAAEYQDVRAAGEFLRSLPEVDPQRIGIYGGSYGGYLTALALARDSGLFAAGVDIHGVHNWTSERARPLLEPRVERAPDLEEALKAAWTSSPISSIATWRSPVLLIHGDDDRNVRFSQTVDLVRRLQQAGVPYEELVIPDDTHHFMRHANWLKVNGATVDFFDRRLGAR